nr:hypothetical protein Iba_chr12bCG7610 [Ipomoea batatas]
MIGNGNKDEDGMVVMFSSIVGFYEIESDVNDFLLGLIRCLTQVTQRYLLRIGYILLNTHEMLSVMSNKGFDSYRRNDVVSVSDLRASTLNNVVPVPDLRASLLRIGYSSLNTREMLSVMSNKGFDSYRRNDVVSVPNLRASTLNDVVPVPDLRASPN